ncbi:mas-related G-protein coupled receptor member H [Anolis carolinensis]|uniref:G-protein coupled receptors family 1 profile domain-containing protein n=1 Tax=Anolis carolinensis TaxID=28377 RepID=G1KUR9_ANOCA|nr:PREDICTED: mas-related G-protein coupled receptor member H-like [Anolis carolinensis]XP_008106538.1 PREDICTED: mas-related G-protein coupled receptor member H-like [Anolis carolinensis]XP_008106539.1 PREDICTED: mas-related G-protein coupled receptor member H-like [Anolis carolinensis]|eukprot:XP_008106537.1 PREDICTED: mas-related G-protein coupled receptor member H-like [Anolis carolinensis]
MNETQHSNTSTSCYDKGLDNEVLVFAIFTMLFCVLGMLGNGIVIQVLGFCKRNTFAIYILNLSFADFGLLTIELIIEIHWLVTHLYCDFPYELFQTIFLLMYSAGQFLLTVISIDRCISVLFPVWYRCHRPGHWFTTVSSLIWLISFTLSAIHLTLLLRKVFGNSPVMLQFMVNAVLCLPLMTISSLILFIKVYFISKHQRRGKLLLAILLTLMFFLILAFPLNVFYFSNYVGQGVHPNLVHYGYLCTCINSTINPLIYFMVGRQKMGKIKKTMKEILQKVFKEEEEISEEMETSECKI